MMRILKEISIVKGLEFTIKEEALKGKKYLPLYYRLDGLTVDIQYCKNETSYEDLKGVSKKIEITIPMSVANFKIDIVSANYSIEADHVDELDLDVVSGNGTITTHNAKDIEMDTVSGNINLDIANSLLLKSNAKSTSFHS